MEEEILKTPSGKQLHDGTVVMLARFPGTKWVVRHGKYIYHKKPHHGWYFSSIPANNILPVNADDLVMLIIVSDDRCWGCIPDPEHLPHHPKPTPLDKTFITVEDFDELDKLKELSLIPNGKLIRVNHVYDENGEDTGAHYYRYDKESDSFIEIFIENEVSEEEFEEFKDYVETKTEYLEWMYLV